VLLGVEKEETGKSARGTRRRFYSEVVRSSGNARVRPLYFYYDAASVEWTFPLYVDAVTELPERVNGEHSKRGRVSFFFFFFLASRAISLSRRFSHGFVHQRK